MANHPSAEKRIRQTARRTEVNRARMSRIRTFVKKVESAIASGNKEAAKSAFDEAAPELQHLSIRVLPGVTAMLAAAARAGAPLGHDFCAINLSDNLKPWEVIEKRLRLAAEADFAIAIYNPRSASRPEGFSRALEVLKEAGCGDRTIIFAHAVTTPKERIETALLQDARPEMADMATLVIVGNSTTRRVGRWVYAPRRAS